MSEDEFDAYRRRLTREVLDFMEQAEAERGEHFTLAIAHHTFLNPLVMRDVLTERHRRGKPRMPLVCFVHGTALKMYVQEKSGLNTDEFPMRFLKLIQKEGVFDYAGHVGRPGSFGIDACVAISNQQVDALEEIFPEFPRDRVAVSPNGYDQQVFHPVSEPLDAYRQRDKVLAQFTTMPYKGSERPAGPVAMDGGFEKVVIFCGKFADWKRLDCLLNAAVEYEKLGRVATLIVGSGPHADQVTMQDMAFKTLGLKNVFFLGPRPQPELATLYSAADVGCFPSYKEPFGLVFIECMGCGTPVIGANSGGPRDFVSPEVGALVTETDDRTALAAELAQVIGMALREDWKDTKGPAALKKARGNYSVKAQCQNLLADIQRLTGKG